MDSQGTALSKYPAPNKFRPTAIVKHGTKRLGIFVRQPFAGRASVYAVLAIWMLASPFGLSSSFVNASPDRSESPDLSQLIEQLDDDDFQLRESAQRQLVAAGDDAIVPLAKKLASCSPETCSRIKRTLYQIAEDCREDNLFKVLSILQARFEISDQQIQPLLMRWAALGRKSIVRRWRDSGAKVEDPHERMVDEGLIGGQPFMPAGRPMAFNGVQVFRGIEPIQRMEFKVTPTGELQEQAKAAEVGQESDEDSDAPPPAELSIEERIDEVLANSTEENIQNVIGDERKSQGFKSALAIVQSFPVEVSVDNNWRGNIADFSQESDSRTLPISKIELDSLSLDKEWAEVLRRHPIESCTIKNCSLSKDIKTDSPLLPASVTTLTVVESERPGDLIGRLIPEDSKVYRFGLVDCELSDATYAAMRFLSIMSLELENLDLGKAEFDRLAALPKLRQLQLNRCRFNAKTFRAFEAELNGRVRLDFTAKAFLGVRGNTAPIMFGPNLELDRGVGGQRKQPDCVITEVVPGAAADDAGVKAGDVILSLGEQEVVDFSDLRVLIAQYGIGDEIVIRVRRGEKELELKTTLGDFKDANNN